MKPPRKVLNPYRPDAPTPSRAHRCTFASGFIGGYIGRTRQRHQRLFGQTVNIAARIENEAEASQCLILNAVLERTHAQDAFRAVVNQPAFSETEARNIALKGIKTPVTVRGFSLD